MLCYGMLYYIIYTILYYMILYYIIIYHIPLSPHRRLFDHTVGFAADILNIILKVAARYEDYSLVCAHDGQVSDRAISTKDNR